MILYLTLQVAETLGFNADSVTKNSLQSSPVDSRFKILSSEKEVRKHYDFFNSNIEIISAEKDSSFLELLEEELILGNYYAYRTITFVVLLSTRGKSF